MNGWRVPPVRVVFGLLLEIVVKLWNSPALGTQNMRLNMGRFLSYGHGVSVPLLGLDFSCVAELLTLAVGHHFDVATAVGTDKDTATVGPESVTRRITNEFKGLVAAGGASVTIKGAACCITSGVVDHYIFSFTFLLAQLPAACHTRLYVVLHLLHVTQFSPNVRTSG